MKCLLALVVVSSLLLACAGCGNVFVRGAINPGFSTVNGVVSVVQLNSVAENGTTILVTFVTFLQQGTGSTIGFCGDVSSRFPLNQNMQVQFTPGQPCASLVVVVIVT